MEKNKVRVNFKQILADTITPVGIYLRLRDVFPNSLLLESSDYHGSQNSFSYICLQPLSFFRVHRGKIEIGSPGKDIGQIQGVTVTEALDDYLRSFEAEDPDDLPVRINGLFGYMSYNAVDCFEKIGLREPPGETSEIPEIQYGFYKYIIAINHFQNQLYLIENQSEGEKTGLDHIESLLYNRNIARYPFMIGKKEESNMKDRDYMDLVRLGRNHCHRGDVFQIVLSRRFFRTFTGDEFNVYRALRSINPSPYLFYFDYGNYRIFGSSPEAQLQISEGKAYIHPIAGTFKRTGDDQKDKDIAFQLSTDPKENSEHVMLVDLARNDLSRNADKVKVETYREIQYYSHVLHMVSKVSGTLPDHYNAIRILADSFPAGTLSGAPKFRAMQLINEYEPSGRGYYGGCLGQLGFDGSLNHAIMIRSFLSMANTLHYQAGAGIVADSSEEKELAEVNNKLMALRHSIELAKKL